LANAIYIFRTKSLFCHLKDSQKPGKWLLEIQVFYNSIIAFSKVFVNDNSFGVGIIKDYNASNAMVKPDQPSYPGILVT